MDKQETGRIIMDEANRLAMIKQAELTMKFYDIGREQFEEIEALVDAAWFLLGIIVNGKKEDGLNNFFNSHALLQGWKFWLEDQVDEDAWERD